jgi:hypothetical protein
MTETMRPFLLAALISLVLPGCGGKAKPSLVDELRGSYRGVRIGDTAAAVQRVFGAEPLSGPNEPIAPREDDFTDIGGPTVIAGGCGTSLRYDHVAFLMCKGHVIGFIVAEQGAQTRRAVGIHDAAHTVPARYPRLTCGSAPLEGGSYPYCGGRVASHRRLWFGRDPIRSITVAAVPLRA